MNDACYSIKIILDILKSNIYLSNLKPIISIFGSSKIKINNFYYFLCLKLSKLLISYGFKIFTGGGLGIMEAANKGSYNINKFSSIGLNFNFLNNIQNSWQNLSLYYNFLFMRKITFLKFSNAYIIFPGGFGTIDEFTEVLALSQINNFYRIPIILVGSNFWNGLIDWMKNFMFKNKLINKKDLKLFQIIDKPKDILYYIQNFYKKK